MTHFTRTVRSEPMQRYNDRLIVKAVARKLVRSWVRQVNPRNAASWPRDGERWMGAYGFQHTIADGVARWLYAEHWSNGRWDVDTDSTFAKVLATALGHRDQKGKVPPDRRARFVAAVYHALDASPTHHNAIVCEAIHEAEREAGFTVEEASEQWCAAVACACGERGVRKQSGEDASPFLSPGIEFHAEVVYATAVLFEGQLPYKITNPLKTGVESSYETTQRGDTTRRRCLPGPAAEFWNAHALATSADGAVAPGRERGLSALVRPVASGVASPLPATLVGAFPNASPLALALEWKAQFLRSLDAKRAEIEAWQPVASEAERLVAGGIDETFEGTRRVLIPDLLLEES